MNKCKKIILVVLSVICILLLIGISYLIYSNNKKYSFKKPDFDTNAVYNEVEDESTLSKVEVQKGYIIYINGNLDIDDSGKVHINFKSDKDNDVYVKFRIYDDKGTLIKESGLLKPGGIIKDIYIDNISQNTDIVIKIMSYEPESYYSRGIATLKSVLTKENN